ncbi:restriction endonuclease subunit S, partial [Escherichia coli]|nr:restriction endonuclease subunit S [Escherichia coli]
SGFPAIHYGQIYTRYGLSADRTFNYVSPELANKLRKAQKNDLLLATTSENDEDVVKPLAWLGDKVAISGDMMLFRHEQNAKYLAHFFQSKIFQAQKMKYITGAKVRRVSSGDLAKITIPIPCPDNPEKSLSIQSEIVRILDKFTALTAELTAELTMRKKQYNYYRDQLLSFKEGEVEWKTLGEVAQYSKTRISFELLDEKNSYDLCQILSPKRPYAAPGASLYRGLKNLKQSDCILDFTNSYSGILAP